MNTVRDRFWIWGHEAGSHNEIYDIPRTSRMTPTEGAMYMGIPNLLMVSFGGKPEPEVFDLYARSFAPLKQVVWSIIGDTSSTRNDRESDLQAVLQLAPEFPNITGVIMDDFFCPPDAEGNVGRANVEKLQEFRTSLHNAPHPLDLWVVLYRHDLDHSVKPYLDQCDVVNFWTWQSDQLVDLDTYFSRLETLVPNKRKVLGCYLFDYSAKKEISIEAMEHQCTLGLRWLEEGRIEGMVFLASCICDLNFAAVEWTRRWIAEVGNRPLLPNRLSE